MEHTNSQQSNDRYCFSGYTAITRPLLSPFVDHATISSCGSPPLPYENREIDCTIPIYNASTIQGGYEMESTNSQESNDSYSLSTYTATTRPLLSPCTDHDTMSLCGSPPLSCENHEIDCTISRYNASNIGSRSYILSNLYPDVQSRFTLSALGWGSTTELLKLYKFIPGKGPETHFELLPGCTVTHLTPRQVYLDLPIDLPS